MQVEIKGSIWDVAATILAGLSLVLVIVNAGLVIRNQSIQVEVSQRQQVINQGPQFARLRQILAQYIANVVAQKKDAELSEVLTRHGITLTNAPATPQGK